MTTPGDSFAAWLTQAGVQEQCLTSDQLGVLKAAFHFRQTCGNDYYSTRLLSHFLLHAQTGLKVAQLARLLQLSRPTASRQQGLSSKEAIQAGQHHMAGRPYGKLLPRYAGPIAEFVLTHPEASRYDLLDFIERTWDIRVSKVALHRFLKKYGLDQASRAAAQTAATALPATASPSAVPVQPLVLVAGEPVPEPPPPFSWPRRTTPVLSCCCPQR
jgi:hypothetical protein